MKYINVKKIVVICLSIIPLWGFANDTVKEIELFPEDYEVVEHTKREGRYENDLQVFLKLKIINPEKLNELKNSTNPIIFINFSNHKYKATGLNVFSSIFTIDDFAFPIDDKGKIIFFKDDITDFRGYKHKK